MTVLLGNDQFLKDKRSKLVQGRRRTNDLWGEAATALIAQCWFIKPVVSELTPVVTDSMVQAGENWSLGVTKITDGAWVMYSITGAGVTKVSAGGGATYSDTGAVVS